LTNKPDQKRKDHSAAEGTPADALPASLRRLILILLLLSGFAGLVYQVLWMKQLGLLFGNTAEATSVTLAAFFAGLAAGSWFWGDRVSRSASPLRLYGYLELGIAATALVYYILLGLFYAIYPAVYHTMGHGPAMLAVKFALALLLIFPPAFCMGGTVPAIAQLLVRRSALFGRTSALIYGLNTFGAALGVVAAAFVLVPALGFRLTYAVAIVISAAVGVAAWKLALNPERSSRCDEASDGQAKTSHPDRRTTDQATDTPALGPITLGVLCFLSGFGVLALEVLWTRMFAQVHENSVYAFAVTLAVVLVGLAAGAWISARLARSPHPPLNTLAVLIVLGGAAVLVGPSLFMAVTHGMTPLSSLEPWPQYVARLFWMGFMGVGLVVVALGAIFPFIMKAQERLVHQPGRALGRLLALNTLGSILGALACGFVFLPYLGMWATMRWIAVMYLAAALLVPRGWGRVAIGTRLAAAACLVLLFTGLDPTGLPTTGRRTDRGFEKVLETWEGSDSTVSVIEKEWGSRAIKVNSSYELGSTGAFTDQANQSRIPLYIFPETKSLFFLGLGTGMSAGAALDPRFENVERIVACELSPHVVTAAKKYMPEAMTGGVFTDPRAKVRVEDGRHYLRVTDQTFDMINADLFLPYRRGAGSLYSLDHYQAARDRLAPGGVYVQWLPLFQLTESEFGIIARTMLEAFGQVTMWRNHFTPGHESIALIGQVEPAPIPAAAPLEREAMLQAARLLDWQSAKPEMVKAGPSNITFYYAGNLTEAPDLFDDYPINTDDRPLIEYQTPRTFRRNVDKKVIWFVGPKIADMTATLFKRTPPQRDPALANCSPGSRRLPLAGLAFHRALVYRAMGDIGPSQQHWQRFMTQWRKAAE